MAGYWVPRGVTTLPCPLLTGAAALASTTPWRHAVWVGYFLQAVAIEAAAGIALLRQIERDVFVARRSGWEGDDNKDENPASRRQHDCR